MKSKNNIKWGALGESVIGANHLKNSTNCQDAFGVFCESDFCIVALADGHGDKRCKYSEYGSQIAVDVAIETLKGFYYKTKNRDRKTIIDKANSLLPINITSRWKDEVEKKYHSMFPESSFDKSFNIYSLFGTTLITAIAFKNHLLITQIGDGDVLIVDKKGKVSNPVPVDENIIGNYTTSLCSANAYKLFRITLISGVRNIPQLLLLSTDGYANSYTTEDGFKQIATDYLQLIKDEGIDYVKSELLAWLKETSSLGSEDDISIGLIYQESITKAISVNRKKGGGGDVRKE